jgi:poly [ADP-ribose] polymerase
MQKLIEVAKSGRAKCRGCRQAIAKGELRYGEEVPNQFGSEPALQWLHLLCAAKKHPKEMQEAMAAYTGEFPNREEVDKAVQAALSEFKSMPFAEWAPTGRSRCLHCRENIDKDTLRIAVEREVEMGGVPRPGVGYLHPRCANDYAKDPELGAKLQQNSGSLKPEELTVLLDELKPA